MNLLYLPIFLLLFFADCKYSPTGANFHSLSIPKNNIDITVLNANSLNVLRGTVTLSVQTELGGHTLKGIQGYLDNNELYLNTTQPGYISFATNYYPDGNDTLKLLLYTSTNSGSMADHLGDEVFYVEKDYPVTLFNAPIVAPVMTGFSIVDGALTINWKKYTQYGFNQYTLFKNGSILTTITDINQNFYRDTTFIGDLSSYSLTTTIFNISFSCDPQWCSYSPSFVSAVTTDGKVKLTWNQFPYYKVFGKYVITGLDTTAEIYSIGDTTVLDNFPPFGFNGAQYTLSIRNKAGIRLADSASIFGPPIHNTPFTSGPQDVFRYIPSKNIFLCVASGSNNVLSTYDGDNLSFLGYSQFSFQLSNPTISSDGNSIYGVVGNNGLVNKINGTTMTVDGSATLLEIIHQPTWSVNSIKASNVGIIAVILLDSNGLMVLSLFDVINKKCLDMLPLNHWYLYMTLEISSDGKYILCEGSLYTYNGQNLVLIGATPSSTFSANDSSLVSVAENGFKIFRCSDLQLIQQISLDDSFIENAPLFIDRSTGLAGTYLNNYGFGVYDLNTGKRRGYQRVCGSVQSFQHNIVFINGYYKKITLN